MGKFRACNVMPGWDPGGGKPRHRKARTARDRTGFEMQLAGWALDPVFFLQHSMENPRFPGSVGLLHRTRALFT